MGYSLANRCSQHPARALWGYRCTECLRDPTWPLGLGRTWLCRDEGHPDGEFVRPEPFLATLRSLPYSRGRSIENDRRPEHSDFRGATPFTPRVVGLTTSLEP
jgi:hypothetical protein